MTGNTLLIAVVNRSPLYILNISSVMSDVHEIIHFLLVITESDATLKSVDYLFYKQARVPVIWF